MKIIPKTEAEKIIPVGMGRQTLMRAMLEQLQPGDALIIEAKDWRTKTPPGQTINRYAKSSGKKFTHGRMIDGSGWIVKRLS